MRRVLYDTKRSPLAAARWVAGKKGSPAMSDRVLSLVTAEQRELLCLALADVVFYRDPPLNCDACDPMTGLCGACAAGLARATAYLELSEELGMQVPA
jgi:hypothetical protein